jgi:hypothetical protein
MPSLHHQALLELETRVTALGGWGAGGVQRSATFAVERMQRPAARIVAGVVDFEHGSNLCEWPMTPVATVSITADTDTQLDTIWLAFCAALKPPWTTPGLKRVLPMSLAYAQAEHDATAYQVQIRLKFQFGPIVAYAPDQSK